MNYYGSWRKLLGNSMSAMISSIEIYNKPRFEYRDEVFVILLINAWELLLKAIVSKSKQRIYYPKKRGEPYKTLSCRDAFWRAANSKAWPKSVEARAVEANIELITAYRDNAVHFYNDRPFASIIYSLAQTSINNYRDVASKVFGKDIANEITWRIMPLGVRTPVDPVQYMKKGRSSGGKTRAAQDFLAFVREKTEALEADGVDTGRLLTVFDVSLQSLKKIDKADIVVGISKDEIEDAVIVSRRIDPNQTYPYLQKDVLSHLSRKVSTFEFQAIAFWFELRTNSIYCW